MCGELQSNIMRIYDNEFRYIVSFCHKFANFFCEFMTETDDIAKSYILFEYKGGCMSHDCFSQTKLTVPEIPSD